MSETNIPQTGSAGDEPFVVTRGRPPREHQFKPGQSGNPKGRPRKSKELRTLLEEELGSRIEATVGGRVIKLTKRQAMIRRLVDKAIQGDPKAITTILAIEGAKGAASSKTKPSESIATDMDALLSNDEQILMSYLARTAGANSDG